MGQTRKSFGECEPAHRTKCKTRCRRASTYITHSGQWPTNLITAILGPFSNVVMLVRAEASSRKVDVDGVAVEEELAAKIARELCELERVEEDDDDDVEFVRLACSLGCDVWQDMHLVHLGRRGSETSLDVGLAASGWPQWTQTTSPSS